MVVVGEAGALAGRRTLPDEAGRETVKPAEQSHLAAARENGVPWGHTSASANGALYARTTARRLCLGLLHSRSSSTGAYHWGEEGLAGISDDHQRLCSSVADGAREFFC